MKCVQIFDWHIVNLLQKNAIILLIIDLDCELLLLQLLYNLKYACIPVHSTLKSKSKFSCDGIFSLEAFYQIYTKI